MTKGEEPSDDFSLPMTTGTRQIPVAFLSDASNHTEDTEWAPHGPFLPCGFDNKMGERRFFWVDANTTMSIGGSSLSSGCVAQFVVDRWDNGMLQEDVETSAAVESGALDTTMNLAAPGYYSLKYTSSGTLKVTIINSSAASSFKHRPLPGFLDRIETISKIMVTSASIMLTNKVANIDLAGDVTGIQLPCGMDWFDTVYETGTPAETIRNLNGQKTIGFKNGGYGFIKPEDKREFSATSDWRIDPVNNITATYFPLFDRAGCYLIYAVVNDSNGRQGDWVVAANVQYGTTDVWTPVDLPRTDFNTFMKAVDSIKNFESFHQNESHLTELWDTIKTTAKEVVNGVEKYGPIVADVASVLAV